MALSACCLRTAPALPPAAPAINCVTKRLIVCQLPQNSRLLWLLQRSFDRCVTGRPATARKWRNRALCRCSLWNCEYPDNAKYWNCSAFPGTFEQWRGLDANREDIEMQQDIAQDLNSTARQLRPVVITVVAAKLAVFTLLMATVNLQAPLPASVEVAEAR